MERDKLCSCIAYCLRRVKGCGNQIASEHLRKALQSLTEPGEEASTGPKPISLYEALALGKAEDQISSLSSPWIDPMSHVVPAAPLATHTTPTGHEMATQTFEAVITESEFKVVAGEIVTQAVADSVAPLQAIIDQLQNSQERRTARIEAMETVILSQQAACSPGSNTEMDNQTAQSTLEIESQPCLTSPRHELARPAVSSGDSQGLRAAEQKEERRRMRTQHLLTRLSRLD